MRPAVNSFTLCLMLGICLAPPLATPLSAQLTLSPETADLGLLPLGVVRLVDMRLRNSGTMPILIDHVHVLDPALSLPSPPVTEMARWLSGSQPRTLCAFGSASLEFRETLGPRAGIWTIRYGHKPCTGRGNGRIHQ